MAITVNELANSRHLMNDLWRTGYVATCSPPGASLDEVLKAVRASAPACLRGRPCNDLEAEEIAPAVWRVRMTYGPLDKTQLDTLRSIV